MIKLIFQLIDHIAGLIDKRQKRRIADLENENRELRKTMEYRKAQEIARLKAAEAAAIRGKYDH